MIYLRDEWPQSARELALAVSRGELLRAGRYYLTTDTSLEVRRALSAGLRPTCVTAAKEHGLWVPHEHGRHVYSRRGATGAGWVDHGWHQRWPERDAIASPRQLLQHAITCLDPLDVGILADSALHLGKVSAQEVAALTGVAPRPTARVLSRVSGLSQSGTESKVRLFLQLHHVTVRPQVKILGVGWVDNLAGRRWIIECDSRAHHTGEDT